MSAMRDTMASQPAALQRILEDKEPVKRAAAQLAGRRIFVAGTGTSFHGANEGAAMLRLAGVEAWAIQATDLAAGDPTLGPNDAIVIVSHRGSKKFGNRVLEHANKTNVPTVLISRQGNPDADLDTVSSEESSCHTASHLGAQMRLAQLAEEMGAVLGSLENVPAAVAAELNRGPTGVKPPARLLEFAGIGINAWTAAEGALKIREAAYVASEGMACESVLHGPAVALGKNDGLVCLGAGGDGDKRLDELTSVVTVAGTTAYRFTRPDLGETLSIFQLTVVVQKIAVEAAELLGTNPDSFGLDLPGRQSAWDAVEL